MFIHSLCVEIAQGMFGKHISHVWLAWLACQGPFGLTEPASGEETFHPGTWDAWDERVRFDALFWIC